MSFDDLIDARLKQARSSLQHIEDARQDLSAACQMVTETISSGHMIATCGNGGSAAQALHLAEELVGRYRSDRRALKAICLNADPTLLTCIANDYGFESIFARQCEGLLQSGDLLIALSTSGKSPNIQRALETAQTAGVRTLGLLGPAASPAQQWCDVAVHVSGEDSGSIQDGHQIVLHILCEAIEQSVVGRGT